jgi:hypothetical protein
VRLVCLSAICAILLAARVGYGAGLETPRLSDDMAAQKYFDPDRFLSTGGLKYEAGHSFTLEPQVGVGYEKLKMEIGSGYEEVFHKVHAQAGGRLDLPGMLHFSAAAKLPVYTYEMTGLRSGVDNSFQNTVGRYNYDLFSNSTKSLSWTGEVGIRLGLGTDLNIFYDQTRFDSFQGGNRFDRMEEKFGTRIIFRFW